MGGPIDMERKGYESIGWYTFFVTLTLDFQGPTLKMLYFRNGRANKIWWLYRSILVEVI